VGKAKLGNLELFPDGVPHAQRTLPLVYINKPNPFMSGLIEKIYSKWVKNDWISKFGINKSSNILSWSHRIIKFNRLEAQKQAFGTPHSKVTFYQETIKGNSSFTGSAVELPYDWGMPGKISLYEAQVIVFTQLKHAAETLIDHQKMLLLETLLATPDQYMKFHINYPGKENKTIRDFMEDGDFKINAIMNRTKDIPFQELITLLIERIKYYNPGFEDPGYSSNKLFIIAPKDDIQMVVDCKTSWKNRDVGHKGSSGLFNKENEQPGKYHTIRGIPLFPTDRYKTPEFPEGIQILHSNKQEIVYNYLPSTDDLLKQNMGFSYSNGSMDVEIHDEEAGTNKLVSYRSIVEQMSYTDFRKALGYRIRGNENYEAYFRDEFGNIAGFIRNQAKLIINNLLVGESYEKFINTFITMVNNGSMKIRRQVPMANTGSFFDDRAGKEYIKYYHNIMTAVISISNVLSTVMQFNVDINNPQNPLMNEWDTRLFVIQSIIGKNPYIMLFRTDPDVNNVSGFVDTLDAHPLHTLTTACKTTDPNLVNQRWTGYLIDDASFNAFKEVSINNDLAIIIKKKRLLLLREGIWETSSAIISSENAVEMRIGHKFDSKIIDQIGKTYFVDMELPFGIKVLNPDNFYVAEDIRYIRLHSDCKPNSRLFKPTITSEKKTDGSIVLQYIDQAKFQKIKKIGFFPLSGKFPEYWPFILNDKTNDLNTEYFRPDDNVKKYLIDGRPNSKFKSRFTLYRHKNQDLVKQSNMVYQAYQKLYDPIKKKFCVSDTQVGFLKHVLGPKELKITNKY
jgi:hypothetical protein